MTTQTELKLITALRSMAALHDLEAPHLRKLASIAGEMAFPEGKIVYREGDAGEAIYLIRAGEVVIEMPVGEAGYVPVCTLGSGQLFGWSALFPGRRKTARARVTKPARVIVINTDRLHDLFQSDHRFESIITQRITEVVADRVKSTRRDLAKAFAPPITEQV
jgi:CRP/FNR family cyclic AMP-dependent transcriptional regulator